MRLSTGTVATWSLAVGGASAFKAAFTPSRPFAISSPQTTAVGPNHATGCSCAGCKPLVHSASCACPGCSRRFNTMLFSETTEEAVAPEAAVEEEVPTEVEAMDGIESAEEAHNADRPARQQLKKKKAGPKGKPLSEFEVGSMIKGTVRSITSYGAFIDIGAQTDGLLHISQLSKGYVADVNEVLKEGEELEVRIVTINSEKSQVALSLMTEEEAAAGAEAARSQRQMRQQKQGKSRSDAAAVSGLADKGWDKAQFVEGTVVSTVDFGCFVRVDSSLLNSDCSGEMDGLVHISALGAGRVSSVTDVVNVDDKVQIRVKSIDGRKVSLSMLSVEDEAAKAESMGGGGHQMEGAKDWKESLEKLQATMPAFTNGPLVEDRRK